MPLYEPHLQELLEIVSKSGALDFTTEIEAAVAESDVIFIAVGTPPRPSGEANLTFLEAVARSIGASMDSSRFRVVVNKSTVPVGSGNLVGTLVREGIIESRPGQEKRIAFAVASNPEFLREGSALADSLYPDRIVIGTEEEQSMKLLRELYKPLITQEFAAPAFLPRPEGMEQVPLVTTTLTSAEMIKYASNAFLATKIGFANEVANICERVGADSKEVMAGIGLDARIGSSFLNAGIGWGGSCFGKDIQSLLHTARDYGYQARLLEASLEVNRSQRHVVIQKLLEKLFILKGCTIALLGLAFKPDTDDLRDAPSLQIAERLLQMGARIKAYDPVAMNACQEQHPELKIQYCNSMLDAVTDADALVVVTEWDEFRTAHLQELAQRMARPVIVDGRNIYEPELARLAGFDYTGIGRREKLTKKTAPLEAVSAPQV
jgi:UDPglucose 6-dehydrogenase